MTALSWFLRPNWASSVKVTYEFKTEIIASRANDEQRRALRATPRKTIEIQVTALHETDILFFHRYLATWQPIPLYVPEIPLTVRPTGAIPSGETTFIADRPIPNWLIPGVIIMLSTRSDTSNHTVTAVDPDTRLVSMATGPTIDFPAVYTRICPMRLCYFPDSVQLSRALYTVADGSIIFEVEPTSEDEITPAAPSFVFETAEVFLEKPDGSTPIEETLTWAREIIDAGFGPTKRFTPAPRQVRGFKATYWRKGSTYALFLLDFFLRMRGRQGEFLMPTYERDIRPAFDVAAGDDFLREPGTLLADSWVRGWPYSNVMIEIADGTRYFRRVVEIHSVTDGIGTDSIMTLDAPIIDPITLADLVRVSWVPTWRFATDQLTLEWRTDDVATVSMAFQTTESISGDTVSPPSTLERVIFLHTGLASWTVPADLDPDIPATVVGLGAGAGGGMGLRGAFLAGIAGLGGSGGAYSGPVSVPLTPGIAIPVQIGGGGAGSTTPGIYAGDDGGNTRFGIGLGEGGVDLLFAEGGHISVPGGIPEGGRASLSLPVVGASSGGDGGLNSTDFIAGPSGGGAAGPHGNGARGADSAVGGGGAGGGAADDGTAGSPSTSLGIGGSGGTAQDGTAGGAMNMPGAHGSGGGGGRGGSGGIVSGAPGGAGGNGAPVWRETLGGTTAGPGGGGGGGGGGTAALNGGAGGQGGGFGGGGGAGGCGSTDTVGPGGRGGHGLIIITYTAIG